MKFDAVRMVEACYAPVSDDQQWLGGLLEAMSPLEQGRGSVAFSLSTAPVRIDVFVDRGAVQPEEVSLFLKIWNGVIEDPTAVAKWFGSGPTVDLMSRRFRRIANAQDGQVRSFLESTASADSLAVLATEPDGHGICLTVPSSTALKFSPRTMHLLTHVSAHLLSATRLRARITQPLNPENEGVEAVLDSSGRLHHAVNGAKEDRARTRLVEAVRRVERARGTLRRKEPAEALSLWKGLTAGRWSLVDHHEADGRRLILARRNEPGVRDPKALPPRERDVLAYAVLGHSNKFIAYLLGIAPSTVAEHLASAAARLGVRSRQELIRAFGPGGNRSSAED